MYVSGSSEMIEFSFKVGRKYHIPIDQRAVIELAMGLCLVWVMIKLGRVLTGAVIFLACYLAVKEEILSYLISMKVQPFQIMCNGIAMGKNGICM